MRKQHFHELFVCSMNCVMHSVVLPCNRAVVLRKVYKVDGKWHGAHSQHIHNFEGGESHLSRQPKHTQRHLLNVLMVGHKTRLNNHTL